MESNLNACQRTGIVSLTAQLAMRFVSLRTGQLIAAAVNEVTAGMNKGTQQAPPLEVSA
jgi:hypothetical protein